MCEWQSREHEWAWKWIKHNVGCVDCDAEYVDGSSESRETKNIFGIESASCMVTCTCVSSGNNGQRPVPAMRTDGLWCRLWNRIHRYSE